VVSTPQDKVRLRRRTYPRPLASRAVLWPRRCWQRNAIKKWFPSADHSNRPTVTMLSARPAHLAGGRKPCHRARWCAPNTARREASNMLSIRNTGIARHPRYVGRQTFTSIHSRAEHTRRHHLRHNHNRRRPHSSHDSHGRPHDSHDSSLHDRPHGSRTTPRLWPRAGAATSVELATATAANNFLIVIGISSLAWTRGRETRLAEKRTESDLRLPQTHRLLPCPRTIKGRGLTLRVMLRA
jgi:hypothetical protein